MKKITGMLLAVATVCGMTTGCTFLREHKEDIHNAIIQYAETKGQEAAAEYIDQLVADGKLGSANAEKIKAAIPQGLEKLKAAMKGTEVSE